MKYNFWRAALLVFTSVCLFATGIDLASAQENTPKLDEKISTEERAFLESIGVDTNNKDFQQTYQVELQKINDALAKNPSALAYIGSNRGYGCDYSPDRWGAANFFPACNSHDRCYSKNSRTNRYNCDQRFLADLNTACKKAYSYAFQKRYYYQCSAIAEVYYRVVRLAGGSHYKGRGLNN